MYLTPFVIFFCIVMMWYLGVIGCAIKAMYELYIQVAHNEPCGMDEIETHQKKNFFYFWFVGTLIKFGPWVRFKKKDISKYPKHFHKYFDAGNYETMYQRAIVATVLAMEKTEVFLYVGTNSKDLWKIQSSSPISQLFEKVSKKKHSSMSPKPVSG